MTWLTRLLAGSFAVAALLAGAGAAARPAKRMNVIFVLVDDQRYDAMGFMDRRVRTPNMDRVAREGVHFRNAFVTTALCSPSRASILTGRYMHDHRVVDNNAPVDEDAVFFPQLLQRAGYQTALIGKWHMGLSGDAPQRGFDKWVSFEGQGEYLPSTNPAKPTLINADGRRVPQRGYLTDELTGYALDWLEKERDTSKPFFLYLSHKGVHADFVPAQRHRGRLAGVRFPLREPTDAAGKPVWVRNQRNSWHGVEFPYHTTLDIEAYQRRYYETLMAVDDSLGRLLAWLDRSGRAKDTVVMLMGDNGFMFGEHGLIDKRAAYEPSMRVPLIARMPGVARPGATVEAMVANIDIAPTVLELAGVSAPAHYVGRSMLPVARGQASSREELLYEYYWEYNYPQTPTTFAIRTPRWKLIQYHGVWDLEELYDLQEDPGERRNLIYDPAHAALAGRLRARLFALLRDRDGRRTVPFRERTGEASILRSRKGSPAAEFPDAWLARSE